MKLTAQKIHSALSENKIFLLITHQNPDGDAIGSISALAQILHNMGKQATLFCATPIPQNLQFIAHAYDITSDPAIWHNHFDTIIICDAGDLTYAGVKQYIHLQKNVPIINIDHHRSNEHFGNINLVMDNASSTTEVLHFYCRTNEIPIDHNMATALMTGLMTDTGNFSNSGTSKYALNIASNLIKRGAHLELIRKHVLRDKTLPALKLWGRVLGRLLHNKEHDMVYTYISQNDLTECGVDEDDINGISNLMNNLQDGKATLVLREKDSGEIKVSMRTTKENIDVSQIAKHFGGGGHKKAAGFSIQARNIDEALDKIWNELKKTM